MNEIKTKNYTQMTVEGLIEALELVEDKSLPVFFYNEDLNSTRPIASVDYTLTDRVDLQDYFL